MNAFAPRFAFAAFGLLLVAAAPANAESSPRHRVYLSDGSVITYKSSTDQYCMNRAALTGSHLALHECHSQEEWAKLGLTITGK